MRVEYWWKVTDRGNLENLKRNLSQSHVIQEKTHVG
jgi:hypothetical protein